MIVEVGCLERATASDAEQLGTLMSDLSENSTGQPVSLSLLDQIISHPDSDQLVARMHGRIVGAATLQAIKAPVGSKAWLEDFVVSSEPEVRGQGVGYKLWQEVEAWCKERSLPLYFLSHPRRIEAHAFYARQGAIALTTTAFKKQF